jgi:MoaA/NifB/PqqE/SkfB family radical SAM enzyme
MIDINKYNDFYTELSQYENKMCWHINDLCNFKCVYCFEPYFNKENPLAGRLSPQQILEAFNSTGRKWHLFISGGEPLLYPNFIELANTVGRYHPFQISTNLSNKYVKPFANEVSPENIFIINASLHIGHHTERSLKQFIENYHLFVEKGFKIVVTYVTYPPLFERIEKDFIYLKEQGIKDLIPKVYRGNFEGKNYPANYTDEQIEIMRKLSTESPHEILYLNKMKFKNQLCRAGKNFFYMNINGDVFSCGSIMNPNGNLFDGTFKPNEKPMCCTAETCNDNILGILALVNQPNIEPGKKTLADRYRSIKELFSI